MKNTVLITGGTSGIGLALAVRYQRSGDCVIICGRDPEKLAKAAAEHPGLETVLCDVSMEADRVKLRLYQRHGRPYEARDGGSCTAAPVTRGDPAECRESR